MIDLHDALYALNSSITHIRGEDAFDANNEPVSYDMAEAQAKLVELQAQAIAQQQAQATAKASALAKLTALGLSKDEVKALVG